MKIVLTEKALREYISNFLDQNLMQFVLGQYGCSCNALPKSYEPEQEFDSTIGNEKENEAPIDPFEEYDEQYIESILRKEVREILLETKN